MQVIDILFTFPDNLSYHLEDKFLYLEKNALNIYLDNKILGFSKLKQSVGNNFNVTQMVKFVCDTAESNVRKEESAD